MDMCREFTGTIISRKAEADGDFHMRLKLDSGQGKPLSHGNMTRQKGCLVVEPVCERTPTQKDAIAPCQGARKVPVPKIGAHVRARGVYVLDNQHGGWAELHAAEFEVIK